MIAFQFGIRFNALPAPNRKIVTPLKRVPLLAFAVNAALVVVMGVVVFMTTREAREADERIDDTVRLLDQITGVEAAVARAESAQRGYFLYRSDHFVAQRDEAIAEAKAQAATAAHLAQGSAVDGVPITELVELLGQRAMRMSSNAESVRRLGAKAPVLLDPSRDGQQLTERIYRITSSVKQARIEDLVEHATERQRRFRVAEVVLVASVLVFLFLIGPAYFALARESRARLRAERSMEQLAESLPGAVFQFRRLPNGDRVYELLSTRSESIRGIDREVARRDPDEVMRPVHEADRKLLSNAMAECERKLQPLLLDYRITIDGQIRWIRATAAPQLEHDGSILWSGHWDDVTVQRELEAELLRSRENAIAANHAKSAFLAVMSHEIRSPMNVVLGMLELHAMTELDPEQRRTVEVIRQSGESLLRIINDILDFSRIEAGKLELRPTTASVTHIVKGVADMYRDSASSKGLVLRTDLDARIAAGHLFDPLRVQQIVSNFTSNALKFTSRGEVLVGAERIAGTPRSQTVRFYVQDTGIGLTPEQQTRIFRPFEQANADIAAHHSGTGLGLAICQSLATMMGGRIDLESEPGRGTTISLIVTFPIADTPALIAAGSSNATGQFAVAPLLPPEPLPQGRGSRVLVVDDHPVNRMVLARQVSVLGYTPDSAEGGAEALAKLERNWPAAIVTDCNMPEIDGYQLAREIRRREKELQRAPIPIIACTANALGGEAERCFEAGMSDYVAKPVQLARLAKKLARWVVPSAMPSASVTASLRSLGPDAPIDYGVFVDNCPGDEAGICEFLMHFKHYHAQDVASLREAAAAGDFEQLTHRAHRIKGASGTLGACRLADVCGGLEAASRRHDVAAVATAMPGFERECQQLANCIDMLLERNGANA